ncbi:hypothetical protein HK097_003753 [Rhizophlyctis rosea]|uniref:PH domain-containing protein n=1 Tax=Rhizophlyctis rosea TaxID=64517 RepID=A0AAD5S310_9FUNG|nr:hypothetical protein HK097_003753 [Rhizophlyctis rosea]
MPSRAASQDIFVDTEDRLAEEDEERAAKDLELRTKLKAESDARVERALRQKAEAVKWAKERETRERKGVEEQKSILSKVDDEVTPTIKGFKSQALLSNFINVQTPDGRFWTRRWAVVKAQKLYLYKDELATKPLETIDLPGTSWRNAMAAEIVTIPNSFAIKPKTGGERVFLADNKAHYYQTLAAIELKS